MAALKSPLPTPAGILRWPSYVLGQLHRETRDALEIGLRREALTLREYFVVVTIDELAHASQQQVADRIHIDRSDLVKLLDHLQQQGLIARERDPEDRRRHVLALTPAGRRKLGRATKISERVTDTAFAALTAEERRTLHRLVLKALGEDSGRAPK